MFAKERLPYLLRMFHSTSLRSGILDNNTALVTGGSRGLGLSLSQRLAQEGCNVILCSRNGEVLRQNSLNLPVINDTQRHSFIQCDVGNIQEINTRFAAKRKTFNGENTSNEFGPQAYELLNKTNILINCAGMMQSSLLLSTKSETIDKIISTNLTGPIMLSQKLLKIMLRPSLKHANRTIINVSSCLGERAIKGTVVYSATKGGLNAFTKALSIELGSLGVRVNCVSPGLVAETEMGLLESIKNGFSTPLKTDNGVSKEAIADAIMYLVTAKHVTGTILEVDNGYHL